MPEQLRIPVHDLAREGKVFAVAASPKHRFSKPARREIQLVKGYGVEGDAHAGSFVRHRYLARRQPNLPNLRQVHLIPCELFEALQTNGHDVEPGALGENITTAGLDLDRMPLRTRIQLGAAAMVELTGLRTPCMLIDRFQRGLKQLLISSQEIGPPFHCGVMAVVTAGGRVTPGDPVLVLLPEGTPSALPHL